MTMRDVWGPWMKHDSLKCPAKNGQILQAVLVDANWNVTTETGMCAAEFAQSSSWTQADNFGPYKRIIRYRIKRPLGMAVHASELEPVCGIEVQS